MTMTPFERRSVWVTTAATLVTGVVYWWMKDMMTPPDPFAVINHPLQPWMLKIHILVAPLQVFAVGLITSRHIWRHYRSGVRKGRKSGLIAAVTFVALVLTGYALQVVSAEVLIRIFAWSHLALGVVYSLGIAVHWPATRGRTPQTPPGTVGRPGGLRSSAVPAHDRRRHRGTRTAEDRARK